MGTTAAVHVESFGRTVRVHLNGHPDHILSALKRIHREELTEDFCSYLEYSTLADTENAYGALRELYDGEDRIPVYNIGFALPQEEAMEVKVLLLVSGEVIFRNREDYNYVLHSNGKVTIR